MTPGRLQRGISLLWFLLGHVTLRVHICRSKQASGTSSEQYFGRLLNLALVYLCFRLFD